MMLAPATLSSLAPICQHGVAGTDRVGHFFDVFTKEMSDDNIQAGRSITKDCIEEGVMTVDLLLEHLYHHDIEGIILRNGGKAGWVKCIEHLLGQPFKRIDSKVPPSAALAMVPYSAQAAAAPGTTLRTTHAHAEKIEKIGPMLKRSGALQSPEYRLDMPEIDALVTETQRPIRTRLTRKDTSRVTNYIFQWQVVKVRSQDTSVDLFEHYAEQLTSFGFPYPYASAGGKKTWPQAFHEFWRNRIYKAVRMPPCLPCRPP